MKRNSIVSLVLVFVMWFGVASKCSSIKSGSNTNTADKGSSRFVGAWKPVPGDKRGEVISSLVINQDGTFVISSTKRENEDIKGTYQLADEKLTLVSSKFSKHDGNPELTVTDDGKLKMTLNNEEKPVYFAK